MWKKVPSPGNRTGYETGFFLLLSLFFANWQKTVRTTTGSIFYKHEWKEGMSLSERGWESVCEREWEREREWKRERGEGERVRVRAEERAKAKSTKAKIHDNEANALFLPFLFNNCQRPCWSHQTETVGESIQTDIYRNTYGTHTANLP